MHGLNCLETYHQPVTGWLWHSWLLLAEIGPGAPRFGIAEWARCSWLWHYGVGQVLLAWHCSGGQVLLALPALHSWPGQEASVWRASFRGTTRLPEIIRYLALVYCLGSDPMELLLVLINPVAESRGISPQATHQYNNPPLIPKQEKEKKEKFLLFL